MGMLMALLCTKHHKLSSTPEEKPWQSFFVLLYSGVHYYNSLTSNYSHNRLKRLLLQKTMHFWDWLSIANDVF